MDLFGFVCDLVFKLVFLYFGFNMIVFIIRLYEYKWAFVKSGRDGVKKLNGRVYFKRLNRIVYFPCYKVVELFQWFFDNKVFDD